MDIVKGRQAGPVRALIYGPEGIGKSTLASKWPAPLFVDAESGTLRLDVHRVQPFSWSAVLSTVDELVRNPQGYQTLVFDTADWLEKMAAASICAEHNQKSIESFGYGKGYTYLAEEWKRFLDKLAVLQAKAALHVVLLGHACMRKFEQPDEAGQYDRWELKLSKQVAPACKEWADLVLFLNYKTIVVESETGKAKAQGGRRVMFAEHHPCWDAKNRFGLPAEMPLDFAALAGIFAASVAAAPEAKPEPKPLTETAAADLAPVPAEQRTDPEKAPLLGQLGQLMKGSGITKEELGAELARKGIVPADMSPRDYNLQTLQRVVGAWAKVVNNINVFRAANKAA